MLCGHGTSRQAPGRRFEYEGLRRRQRPHIPFDERIDTATLPTSVDIVDKASAPPFNLKCAHPRGDSPPWSEYCRRKPHQRIEFLPP